MGFTEQDRARIRSVIEHGSTLLACAAAELYLAHVSPGSPLVEYLKGGSTEEWTYAGVSGALCFIVSRTGDYYFRIYRFSDIKEVFSVELFKDLEYKSSTAQFHYFESDDCLVGFNLGDAVEAEKFMQKVCSLLPVRSTTFVRNVGGPSAPANKELSKSKRARSRPRSKNRGIFRIFGRSTSYTKASSKRASSKRSRSQKSSGSKYRSKSRKDFIFTEEDLTPEWRRILKQAGLSKKDVLQPKMQRLIKEILAEKNIATEAPPLMSDAEVHKHYNQQEAMAYERYQKELVEYEQQYAKYLRDLETYNQQVLAEQQKQEALRARSESTSRQRSHYASGQDDDLLGALRRSKRLHGSFVNHRGRQSVNPTRPSRPTEQRLRSVQQALTDNHIGIPLPPPTTDTATVVHSVKPTLTAERPRIPALPKIGGEEFLRLEREIDDFFSDENEVVLPKSSTQQRVSFVANVNASPSLKDIEVSAPPVPPRVRRGSKLAEQPVTSRQEVALPVKNQPPVPMLGNLALSLKNQMKNLRHISALPDIKNLDSNRKNDLLNTLREKIMKRRDMIIGQDEEESSVISDW